MEQTQVDKDGLSMRGWANVKDIMPKISAAVAERERIDNPKIDLASAENWLIREELVQVCKDAINANLGTKDFSYPKGFSGYPEVLSAFASFFNAYFNPVSPVMTVHLATAPGAASCIDTLLYNICDPGDGVLVPAPYWSGFDFQFKARSSIVPIPVATDSFDTSLSEALIDALEKTLKNSTRPIKALLLTNPSNPISRCYSRLCLEKCIQFSNRHGLHYISDEVCALTRFHNPEIPNPEPFVSALSIDVKALGCDLSRVHTVWSTSKDLGQSGVRMGCTVSQENLVLQTALSLVSYPHTSTLSAIFVSALLTSPRLPHLLNLNSERLHNAYKSLVTVLNRNKIPYIPACAGLYVLARVAPYARTWEDESEAIVKFKHGNILISGARHYHGPESEKGWARISFAVAAEQLAEAVRRIDKILSAS